MKTHEDITADDVRKWGKYRHSNEWFAQVLRGEYAVDDAREDCLSIINEDTES